MAGTLHLERSPRRSEAADTSTPRTSSTDADWNVRVYASQTRQESDAAPLGQLGVSVGLNLRMLDGRPDVVMQSGVQDGLPQLAVLRTTQWDDLTLQSTVRVLPTPAISLSASGPYVASFSLTSVVLPVLTAALSGTPLLTGTGSGPQLVDGSSRQVLLVRVGVPGVQVRSNGTLATTDASGQATLPLSTSFSVLTLTVQPAPGALVTVADFTPYLLRTNLRQLPAFAPCGTVARLGETSFTVPESRYVQLGARNGR